MRIVDSYPQIEALCATGPRWDEAAWARYITALSPSLALRQQADRDFCVASGYSYQEHYLPVLEAAWRDKEGRRRVHDSFAACCQGLEQRIAARFGRCPQVELLFYFGLCHSAGWVTELDGRSAILFGLEKILELHWEEPRLMAGLLYHELGHAYQAQFGVLERSCATPRQDFLWQLFCEGFAMVFEQELWGSPDFYHQDVDGWAAWCRAKLPAIKADFEQDLDRMSAETQRWFGDWVRYQGRGDVGYYLGCRLLRYAAREVPLDQLISWKPAQVEALWRDYLRAKNQ